MSFPSGVLGYCPECDCDMEITVNFTEIRVVGGNPPSYRKGRYLCEYAAENECATAGAKGEDCPIYKLASF